MCSVVTLLLKKSQVFGHLPHPSCNRVNWSFTQALGRKVLVLHYKQEYVSQKNVYCFIWVSTKHKLHCIFLYYYSMLEFLCEKSFNKSYLVRDSLTLACRIPPTFTMKLTLSLHLVASSNMVHFQALVSGPSWKVSCIFMALVGWQALLLIYFSFQVLNQV